MRESIAFLTRKVQEFNLQSTFSQFSVRFWNQKVMVAAFC